MMASANDRYRMRATHFTMANFADHLSKYLGAPVADSTGLNGYYDLDLIWLPDHLSTGGPAAAANAATRPSDADTGETLFSALQSQLGLTLEKARVDVLMFIVDRVERLPIVE